MARETKIAARKPGGARSVAFRKPKNPRPPAKRISELGQRLMKIREEVVASGARLLTLLEVRREVAERRGGLTQGSD